MIYQMRCRVSLPILVLCKIAKFCCKGSAKHFRKLCLQSEDCNANIATIFHKSQKSDKKIEDISGS